MIVWFDLNSCLLSLPFPEKPLFLLAIVFAGKCIALQEYAELFHLILDVSHNITFALLMILFACVFPLLIGGGERC